jgi:hypothetical protein
MKKLLPFLALVVTLAIVGCSDKKSTNPDDSGNVATTKWASDSSGSFWLATVDGSSSASFKYFSFGTKDTVSITDGQASTDTTWDIAFKRTNLKSNGGVSGSKDVLIVDLASIHSSDSIDFASVTDTTEIRNSDWREDIYNFAIGDWYTTDMMHHMIPTHYVYTLKDASGKYVKFTVSDVHGGVPPLALDAQDITINYVYAASGTDISGAGVRDSFNVGPDTIYYDFSTGGIVTPADPANSLDWDFAVAHSDIYLNSGLFGMGAAAAYLNTDSLGNPLTDFDNITVAETQPTAYSIDSPGSPFTGWYDYDDVSHTLKSFKHVYLIKIHSDIYKMQILSYYHNVNDIPASGWYSFKWLKLEL